MSGPTGPAVQAWDVEPGKSYEITIRNPDGLMRGRSEVSVDGVVVSGGAIALVDDGARREVVVTMRRDG